MQTEPTVIREVDDLGRLGNRGFYLPQGNAELRRGFIGIAIECRLHASQKSS